MKKQYRVAGPYSVLGHAPGESFTAELDPEAEAIHLEGGTLEIDKDGSEKPQKVPCPACVEQKLKRPPTFDDLDGLQKHYADKHPALEAPDDLRQKEE